MIVQSFFISMFINFQVDDSLLKAAAAASDEKLKKVEEVLERTRKEVRKQQMSSVFLNIWPFLLGN